MEYPFVVSGGVPTWRTGVGLELDTSFGWGFFCAVRESPQARTVFPSLVALAMMECPPHPNPPLPVNFHHPSKYPVAVDLTDSFRRVLSAPPRPRLLLLPPQGAT